MKTIDSILSKVFVKRFYSENSGFFLVVLGVCFGFLKTPQHFELNEFLAHSPIFYSIPFALWLLYALKVWGFSVRKNRIQENTMFNLLVLEARPKLLMSAIRVQFGLLAPIVFYGGFMAYVAMEQKAWFSAILVVLFLTGLVIGCSYGFFMDLLRPKEYGTKARQFKLTWGPKHYSFFYVHHLLNSNGLKLILIKLFSLLILFISTQVFLEEATDLRYLTLGMLLSATANSYFSFEYVEFEKSHLQLFRNLPLGFGKKMLSFFITFCVLSIPEFVILLGQTANHMSLSSAVSLIMMLPAMLLFFQAMAYLQKIHQELFTKQVFLVSAILFFVILGHLSPLGLSALVIFSALVLLRFRLNKSEMIA